MINDYEGVIFLDSDTDDDRADNRPSRFHTFMHSSFSFNDDSFEVGLLEIQIPYTWKNLRSNQWVGGFTNDTCSGLFRIDSGCYYNAVDLIDMINRFFDGPDAAKLIYDPLFGRIRSKAGVHNKVNNVHIIASKELALMLGMGYGFSHNDNDPIPGMYYQLQTLKDNFGLVKVGGWPQGDYVRAHFPVNLQASMERFYISSSIVKHRAHSQHELMRAIPVSRNRLCGEIEVISYDRPIFVPVAHQSFDRIEICIRDKDGNEPEFTSGNVVVTLEFRRNGRFLP